MALTTKSIADMISDIECRDRQPSALRVLHELLLKSLSPAHKKAYDLVLSEPWIISQTCMGRFGWSINYAGNVLKSLMDLGLVRRQWSDKRHTNVYRIRERRLGYDEMEAS